MKAPLSMPFVKKGEDIPPSGVTLQAVLGFVLPFLLIALTGVIVYFMIVAKLNSGAAEGAFRALLTL